MLCIKNDGFERTARKKEKKDNLASQVLPLVISAYGSPSSLFFWGDISIGGYWEDIVHDFQRVDLLAQDVGLSLKLNKCKVICRDHTTLGSY